MAIRTPLIRPLLLLALFPASAAAQDVSALASDERAMLAHIDERSPEAVALLEDIVNINSGTLNPAGVRRVYERLAPEFEALGFDVSYARLPEEMERGGHLVARLRPSAGPARGRRVLLIGHLDTVFEEDSPFQTFTMIDDSTARGPGVSDMKGGDVVILQALQALASVGGLDGARITVVMTGDEEAPGRPLDVARAALIEAGIEADVALGFEGGSRGTDGITRAVVARRSSSSWRLDVAGRPAHSSGVFSEGVGAGAIYEAARILDGFYEGLRGDEGLTFNTGLVVGGTEVEFDAGDARGTAFGKTNVVAGTAIATGDIRTLTNEQLESTRARMREIVRESLPRTSAEIGFSDGYPSMPPTEANYELLEMYSRASRAMGEAEIHPFDPARRGAADVSFVAKHVDAALDGLGPFGEGSHTVEETVDLGSLRLQAKRAAVLIYRLTR